MLLESVTAENRYKKEIPHANSTAQASCKLTRFFCMNSVSFHIVKSIQESSPCSTKDTRQIIFNEVFLHYNLNVQIYLEKQDKGFVIQSRFFDGLPCDISTQAMNIYWFLCHKALVKDHEVIF